LSIFKKGMYLEMREESAVCRVTLPIHFAKCHLDCPHCHYSDIATYGNHCLYAKRGCIWRWKKKVLFVVWCSHSFRQMSLRLLALPLFWHSNLWQPLSIFKKGMYLEMREESAVCRVTLPIHFAKCHLDCPHCRYSDIATYGNHCLYSRRGCIWRWEKKVLFVVWRYPFISPNVT
jgi:transposase-like protein